jgi:starch synthase
MATPMKGGAVLVLHSHLPYVLGHGTWPHGEHWLMESAVECYLPLLETCQRLHAGGFRDFLTIGFTPVLAAQLADPRFPDAFGAYLVERRRQALKDAALFGKTRGEERRRELALTWAADFERARRVFFEELDADLIGAWRQMQDAGAVEILTSALTHAYLPLVLNDVCVWGQVRGGVAVYERLFGRAPRGIWLPECAYRPRYAWRPPLGGPPRERAGLEEILEAAGLEYFVADSHLLEPPSRVHVDLRGDAELWRLHRAFLEIFPEPQHPHSPGFAYRVQTLGDGASRVAVLVRHPSTGTRVWNRDAGYPGNPEYLDFSKQHRGGLRYWRVTDRHVPIESKELYDPAAAAARARLDGRDFAREVQRLREWLPLVVAAYDTELFGHWWREGAVWLEHVVRGLGADAGGTLTGSEAVRAATAPQAIPLPEGSWGEGGFHWVWYNAATRDLWGELYSCETAFVEILAAERRRKDAATTPEGGTGAPPESPAERRPRLLALLAQELVLAESSDWPFLVTGEAARDYARERMGLHVERFRWLAARLRSGEWSPADEERLAEVEAQDLVFPDLDLAWWRGGPAAALRRAERTVRRVRRLPRAMRQPEGPRTAFASSFGWMAERVAASIPGDGGRLPRRVLHVASEGLPFSKTGGLGDVVGALPAAQAALGHEVTVVLPAHRPFTAGAPAARPTGRSLSVWLGPADFAEHRFDVLEARVGAVRVLLLENPEFFERGGIYSDADGNAWEDNWLRFAAFARAALLVAAEEGAEVVHCHDWQAALVPVYRAAGVQAGLRYPFRTVLTIHNMAYQGNSPAAVWPALGLPDGWFTPEGLELNGGVSYLKGGILFADALTTVSPTYAREILAPEQGHGLDGVLRGRRERLTGILNGVDYTEWDPARDRFIARPYSARDLTGKAACKTALQEAFGLAREPRRPLAGIVSRLVGQKGWDILLEALPPLVERGLQVAALGSGEARFEEGLRELVARYPGRVAARIGFDRALAHQIEAGADLFLMPSRYEPCGLNQMYSLRYGTLPVVRATGGLADTVIDASDPLDGTGFVFGPYTAEALIDAVLRALAIYDSPHGEALQRRAMAQDFSWERAARRYAALYGALAEEADAREAAAEAAAEVAAAALAAELAVP